MKYYKYISLFSFFLMSMLLNGQETLNTYLETAAENNPGLKAKFSAYMAALERAPQVGGLPDPQVAFAYFIKPVETRVGPQQFKISASQMFPWFGTLGAKENAAIEEAKAKYELFEDAKSKLFNDVKATYFNLYYNQKSIAINKENIELLHSFKNLAHIKVQSGMVSAVDQYRISMEVGDLENQLAFLIDKQWVLQVMFNNLLHVQSNETVDIPDDLWQTDFHLTKQNIMDSIYANNHQLLSLSLQKEALNYREQEARKMGLPQFSIGVDYTFIGKGPDNLSGTDAILFPKIGLSIPLYRNKYKAMANEVLYLQEGIQYQTEEKENFLEVFLENGWKDYRDANRRTVLFEKQRDLAKQAMSLLETDYVSGKQSFEEILRMERKLLKYSLELEKAKADKQAAIAFFNYLIGN